MKTWRLTSEVVAFVSTTGNKVLYLASPEKKKYLTIVKNIIPNPEAYKELPIVNNKFRLRLDKELGVQITSDALSGMWFTVNNFIQTKDFLGDIICNISNDKGNFGEVEFEPVFQEGSTDVSFVCKELDIYSNCLEEMRRRVNCEICGKTKKRIPGHRYDSTDKTMIFLGTLLSRKTKPEVSEYLTDVTMMPEVYLYVNRLKESEKTISDVLNNRVFGIGEDDIIVKFNVSSSMVDSGEVITGTLEYDQDTLESLLIRSIDHYRGVNTVMSDVYSSLLPLSFLPTNITKNPIDITKYKDIISDFVSESLFHRVLGYWNVKQREDRRLGEDREEKDNVKSLVNIYLDTILDENAMKQTYYSTMLNLAKVDINKLSEEVLKRWDSGNGFKDFSMYLKYYLFRPWREDICYANLRKKSLRYSRDTKTIESVVGDNKLKEAIINIIREAENLYGLGVEKFVTINTGSKSNPLVYTNVFIGLHDIVNFFGGEDKVPEEVKTQIVSMKFVGITVDYDKNGNLN